jgi:hypothetical protein
MIVNAYGNRWKNRRQNVATTQVPSLNGNAPEFTDHNFYLQPSSLCDSVPGLRADRNSFPGSAESFSSPIIFPCRNTAPQARFGKPRRLPISMKGSR